ncbi:MAG TPA: serine hydrolase domain-containing protein, partial [Magnetospirillaceae bacterium]|nr:serine hydrolase domain-containing protein [Magnetospirillaceae bacterium]
RLLEDVTGTPFPQLLQDQVLGPIGMTRSGFEQPLSPAKLAEAAIPYDSQGKPIAGGPHTYPELAPDGLWTTPSDLARYAIEVQKSLKGQANHVLSQAMTQEMLKQLWPDPPWGIGPELGGTDPSRPLFRHTGGNEGFRCDLVAYQQGDGVVVMTNGDNGAELMFDIVRTLAHDQGWPDFLPMVREAAAIDGKVTAHYAGYYRMGRYSIAEASLDKGALSLKLPGEETHRLYPASERDWFFADIEADVTFHPDAKGLDPAMVLHQSGEDAPARRIDAPGARQIQDELAAKVKNQAQDPATEAALRRHIAELRKGEPDYGSMSAGLAAGVKRGLSDLKDQIDKMGAVKSVTFTGVDAEGSDLYKVVFEHGEIGYHILIDLRGKIESLGFL